MLLYIVIVLIPAVLLACGTFNATCKTMEGLFDAINDKIQKH